MMCKSYHDILAHELRAEADIDFFDVPLIAESIRERFELRTQDEIRTHTLAVIERLLKMNVHPGDYDFAKTISFWSGKPDEHLRRIEREWIDMGHTPTSIAPICWFGLRNNHQIEF